MKHKSSNTKSHNI